MSAVRSLGLAPSAYQPREFAGLLDLDGLSPAAIDLHLDIYRGYVASVNRLLEDRELDMRSFTFEYNGMVLHELFFEQFGPAPSQLPRHGKFVKALGRSFASLDAWKDELRRLARTRSVGWVVCARDEATNRLFNAWIDLHHLGLPARTHPVLVIDLWEHAWLDDYGAAGRRDYFEAVLAQVDWQVVERRCWTPRG